MDNKKSPTFKCPDCETLYKIPEGVSEKDVKVKCRKCGSIIAFENKDEKVIPVSLTYFKNSLVRKENGNIIKIANFKDFLDKFKEEAFKADDEISNDGAKWDVIADRDDFCELLEPEEEEPIIIDENSFKNSIVTRENGKEISIKNLAELQLKIARGELSSKDNISFSDNELTPSPLGEIPRLEAFFQLSEKSSASKPDKEKKSKTKSDFEFKRDDEPLEEQLQNDAGLEDNTTSTVENSVQKEAKKSLAEIMEQQKAEKEKQAEKNTEKSEDSPEKPAEKPKKSLADVLEEENKKSGEEKQSSEIENDASSDPRKELKDIIDKHTSENQTASEPEKEKPSGKIPSEEEASENNRSSENQEEKKKNSSPESVNEENSDDELSQLLTEDEDDLIFEEKSGFGKIAAIIVLLCILAAGGIYFYFFHMNRGERIKNLPDESSSVAESEEKIPDHSEKNIMEPESLSEQEKKEKKEEPAEVEEEKKPVRKTKTVTEKKPKPRRRKIRRSSPAGMAKQGWRLIDRGNFNKAIKIFSIIIKNNPSFDDAYYGLAEAYNLKGEKQKAVKYYKQYLKTAEGRKNKQLINNIINNISE